MNNKIMFYVINEEGIREDAQILAKYRLSNGNDYITYTYNELNDNNMVKIYTTGIINENGNYSYREIISDDEWNQLKELMKSIAREEEIDANYISDLKFEGEEVSIRKPKKLLVSKNFADTLASKYIDSNKPNMFVDEIPTFEEKVVMPEISEKEDILNKTIEIPTFEELQARNKNIENVINSSKQEQPEVKIEKVEVKPVVKDALLASQVQDTRTYKEQFKEEVEPLLMGVYEKQMKHIEELEEELSKTKFDLFEKQKEALSLKKEKEELEDQSNALKQELQGAQDKMNGILNVIQGNNRD